MLKFHKCMLASKTSCAPRMYKYVCTCFLILAIVTIYFCVPSSL